MLLLLYLTLYSLDYGLINAQGWICLNLHESAWIPHLFGAPASPYRHGLIGSSWQLQQQQQYVWTCSLC